MAAMMSIRVSILIIAGAIASHTFAAPASRQAALVESVTGNPAGVRDMTYVETGKIITLGEHESITLSYLRSCVQETITGGIVKVGTDQSEVQSGTVKRTAVACDPGQVSPDANEPPGGVIVRGAVLPGAAPSLTLYGSSPIVELKGPGTLVIERLGQAGERYSVNVTNEQLVNGRFYDFAKVGRNFAPGGVYSMKVGADEIVFKIDPHAKPGGQPILSRLLRFGLPG
jgi:hypothetical protein